MTTSGLAYNLTSPSYVWLRIDLQPVVNGSPAAIATKRDRETGGERRYVNIN